MADYDDPDPGDPQKLQLQLENERDILLKDCLQLRLLMFDPSKLKVEELREEMKARGLPSSGPKSVLLQRLNDSLAEDPDAPRERVGLNSAAMVSKRKRLNNKKEPQRDEFESQEEYLAIWEKWRDNRDSNNESVKRSRENAKRKKQVHESLCHEREMENSKLRNEVSSLRDQIQFLSKVLQHPENMNDMEYAQLQEMLRPITGGGAFS